MDSGFEDKSIKVLVVEGSGATRTLMTEVIRKLGFSDVTGVPSIKDALGVMEAENVGWILTPLMADQPENALHVLKIATEVQALRNMRVSLLVEEEERYSLPAAFQHGLLSWHRKPFTKDSLTEEMETLFTRYGDSGYESSLVSGSYLREILTEEKQDEDLLAFEKGLISVYPARTELMLNLPGPLARLDQKPEAKAVLRQIKMIEPSWEDKVKELGEKYFAGEDLEGGDDEKFNFLGVEKVVVVDSDDAICKNLEEIFGELGVENISTFSDGESALAHIEAEPDPGIVIQEWRIQKLPGPLFLQKIRAKAASASPVIVLSSLLEQSDLPLLREMGVAGMSEKPFRKEDLIKQIIRTIQQDRVPTEQAPMERKIREFLKGRKTKEADEIKVKYMADDKIPEGAKKTIEAEFAYAAGDYEKARDCGIEAIKLAGDSIFVLNLLGKALMNLRDFEVALRCFEKAQTLAPLNIERLCAIAEVHSEMGNEDKAQESLQEAENLDEDSVKVKESKAKVAINAGDLKKAKELMGKLDAIEDVVSFMNNSAVAMARCDMVDEGIEQYRKTIKSIPDDKEEIKAVVMYNLALAHARADELDEASMVLKRCVDIKSRVKERAESLYKRVTKAVENGTQLNLQLTSGVSAASLKKDDQDDKDKAAKADEVEEKREVDTKENREVLAAVEVVKGDLGCYLIYTPKETDEKATALLRDPPRFSKRDAIEREESRGADKMAQSAS